MFTVKIESEDNSRTSLRSWSSVDVFTRDSDTFELLMEYERQKEHDFPTEEEEKEWLDCLDTHKAILRTVDGESEYFLCDWEVAFITDQSGKTVHIVR